MVEQMVRVTHIGLPKVAVWKNVGLRPRSNRYTCQLTNTDRRTRRHNPPILLLLEYRPNRFCTLVLLSATTLSIPERTDLEGTSEVYSQDEIPFLPRHGSKRAIAQYTRVRHKDVHAAKCVHGSLDDAVTVFCRTNNRCRLATNYKEPPART